MTKSEIQRRKKFLKKLMRDEYGEVSNVEKIAEKWFSEKEVGDNNEERQKIR